MDKHMSEDKTFVKKIEITIDDLVSLWKRRKFVRYVVVFVLILVVVRFLGFPAYDRFGLHKDLETKVVEKEEKIQMLSKQLEDVKRERGKFETMVAPFQVTANRTFPETPENERLGLFLKEIDDLTLSPRITVTLFPFFSDPVFAKASKYEYPLEEYTLSIMNENKNSVVAHGLTIEFFFENTVTEAYAGPILKGGGGLTIFQFRSKREKGSKVKIWEMERPKTPMDKYFSIQVKKNKIDDEMVNSNIVVFACDKWPEIESYEGSIVINLTKRPTHITKGHAIGKYSGSYSYEIKGKKFSKKVSGPIPTPRIGLILAKHHYEVGNDLINKAEYNCAILEYSEAIELNPNYRDAYHNRADAYGNTGEYDKAISDYDLLITELTSKDANVYWGRGFVYAKKGEYTKAVLDCDKALELHLTQKKYAVVARVYSNAGNFYTAKCKFTEAISCYDKAIKLNPNFAMAYNNRANTYRKIAEYDRAISDCDTAIKLNPDLFQPYFNRALTWKALNEQDKAKRDFKKACDLGISKACDEYDKLSLN